MKHADAKLKRDIQVCLTRLNALIKEFAFEERAAPNATVAGAVKRIASELGTTPELIRTRSNERHLVLPRQICQYVIRQSMNTSYPEIAAATGIEDHTTVL